MSRLKGLRLPLKRRPDPVLTEDELHWIEERCTKYIESTDAAMKAGLVSESVIRGTMTAESTRGKVQEVLASLR